MAIAQLQVLSPLLKSIGGDQVLSGGGGADIDPICQTGIVCAGWDVLDPRLSNDVTNNPCTADANGAWVAPVFDPYKQQGYDSGYFWFHHSEADTMERIDPTQLNTNAAALAIWTYSIAQLPELLPRNNYAPTEDDDDSSSDFLKENFVFIIIIPCVVTVLVLIVVVIYKREALCFTSRRRNSSFSEEYKNDVSEKAVEPLMSETDA